MFYYILLVSKRRYSFQTDNFPLQLYWSVVNSHYYTLNSLSLFRLAESAQWIFGIGSRDVITADYIHVIIMSRTLKVTGNHVMSDRGAWFLRVIMSSSRAFVLLTVNMTLISSVQCVIKQLLDSVFVISRIIEVSVTVISLSLRHRLITPTSISIILDVTKTSSHNCLLTNGKYLHLATAITHYSNLGSAPEQSRVSSDSRP